MYKNMKILFTLMCVINLMWILTFVMVIWTPMEDKWICLIFLFLFMTLELFWLRGFKKDMKAYRDFKGTLVKELSFTSSIIASMLSILFTIYFIYLLFEHKATFTQLTCSLVLSSYVVILMKSTLIIFGEEELYFCHKRIPYKNIRKVDTDQSVNRYVIVMLYEKKTYRQRMEKPMYLVFQDQLDKHIT